MPITPYHFGPSGLLGLLFRRWIDPVVFVAANIVVDVEVLAAYFGWSHESPHQVWHLHTLLLGCIVGGIFGLACWDLRPIRRIIEGFLRIIHVPYTATAGKMIFGGAAGIGLHILIDSIYHYDVQLFWPWRQNPLYRGVNIFRIQPDIQQGIRLACIILFLIGIVVWLGIIVRNRRRTKRKCQSSSPN